jgi:hypothetical protein
MKKRPSKEPNNKGILLRGEFESHFLSDENWKRVQGYLQQARDSTWQSEIPGLGKMDLRSEDK